MEKGFDVVQGNIKHDFVQKTFHNGCFRGFRMSRAEVLVVDSGGFIKNAPLRELAGRLVTLQDVVSEIRDKETRQRMQVLPYDLEFRNPSSLGLAKVSEFAKKTGDFASLSLTDLNVLAVTWDLEVELRGGSDHLKVFSSLNLTLKH